MQNTSTIGTNTNASNAAGTITAKRRPKAASKTRSTDNYVISTVGLAGDQPRSETTNTLLAAAKIVKSFRQGGIEPDAISIVKNGRRLGWASFASMVSVRRRQNAQANAAKPKAAAPKAAAQA